MSFENGTYIPDLSEPQPSAVLDTGTGALGSRGGNHHRSSRGARSTNGPYSQHSHPSRGQEAKGKKTRGVDFVGQQRGRAHQNNRATDQRNGVGGIITTSLMGAYSRDLNPEAPSFQPRQFNAPTNTTTTKELSTSQQAQVSSPHSSRSNYDQQWPSKSNSRGASFAGQSRQQQQYYPHFQGQQQSQRAKTAGFDKRQRFPPTNQTEPQTEEDWDTETGAAEGGQNERKNTVGGSRNSRDYRDRPSSTFNRANNNNWRSSEEYDPRGTPKTNEESLGRHRHFKESELELGLESSSKEKTEQHSRGEGEEKSNYFFDRSQAKWKEEMLEKKRRPDARNQRETLTDQLTRNAYDCMICVEKVRRTQPIWSCQKCFNVFHLNCLRKWANSSADDVGWRCPGCQTYNEVIPVDYMCFCGAMKNPQGTRTDVPHSCGQTCGRDSIGGIECIHSCIIQCHPGPCPPCESVLTRNCCCGKTNAQVKCKSKAVMTCGGTCDKLLNCLLHKCSRQCHGGSCDPCSFIIKLDCYCGSDQKEVICTEETALLSSYSCKNACKKNLNCKKHFCLDLCHPGGCKPCKMSPEAVLSCPCGQTPISEVCKKNRIPIRTSCLDPIPTCGKSCRKILVCGEPGQRHLCQVDCHIEPECPTCPLTTPIKCRCGNKTFEIPCIDFKVADDVLCEKKCTKKRNCGRHKCNMKCCIDHDHICPIVCGRALRCNNHNCTLLCHNGHCPPCRSVSFEELACECGATVIYPPVSCGTKPPMCHQPCPRTHDCEHPVLHTCHSDPTCPPCTVLMPKWCNGNHDLRKNVQCHIKQVSCGQPCNKSLPCGQHKCPRFCHPGDCHKEGEICTLGCEIRRKDCGHLGCGSNCHQGPCPETKCKVSTEVTCDCGRKKETMICWKREKEYDRLVVYLSNLELKRLAEDKNATDQQEEPKKDENGVLISVKNKTPKTNILDCDKECARIERNRKMVEALQLEDPDVCSTFGTPNYTDFLVSFAKKNPQFVEMVHQRLTSLVLKARKSKRKNETYGFESMNRDKRHLVHEYSDHFGCLSESFDEEPNRNVIITASKEKSYCPSVSLIDAVFRPNVKSERKNAFDDVAVFQNSKSQIMRPANGKIMQLSAPSGSGMVALTGPSTSAWQSQPSNNNLPIGDYPPLS